jgi:GcrA cell cycle regulator
MSWTDEKIEDLKKLWAKGLSTAEIGRELGVSKNAVVGKSHRLGLKPRPSPISGKAAEAAPAAPAAKAAAAPAKPKAAKAPKAKETEKIGDIIDLGPHMCRWPFGDPGDDDFHFCGRQVAPSKPYCPEHCAVAYVTKSNSRDRDRSSSSASSSASS